MSQSADLQEQTRWSGLLDRIVTKRSLSLGETRRIFTQLFSGDIPFVKAKSLLLLLAKKGETAAELLGCLRALQNLEKPIGPRIRGLMDTCGTGGDGRYTLNISTLVALVIAGAGGRVAKHGNRAISSRSGSSDLMESFGVRIDAGSEKMIRAIRRFGLGYFHAPAHHPVFARMQPLRRSLKRRTLLNLLGPLVNPMRLDHQLVGVSERRLVPLYADVLSRMGRRAALVCHSADGMDEISTRVPTTVAWVTPGKVRMSVIRPKALGLRPARASDLKVQSVKQSRSRARNILSGKDRGPARDMIVLNAAYGLLLCGRAKNIREGIALARRSLDSGKALKVLKQLKAISR